MLFQSLVLALPLLALAGPSSVQLVVDDTGGNGCTTSPSASLSSDTSKITINFPSDVTASAGPGIDITQGRRECTVLFRLTNTAGWKFAVTRATFNGRTALASSGSSSTVKGSFYSTGTVNDSNAQASFAGPRAGGFSSAAGASKDSWSACGGSTAYSIKTAVNTISDNTQVSSSTLSGSQTYEIKWSSF